MDIKFHEISRFLQFINSWRCVAVRVVVEYPNNRYFKVKLRKILQPSFSHAKTSSVQKLIAHHHCSKSLPTYNGGKNEDKLMFFFDVVLFDVRGFYNCINRHYCINTGAARY